MCPLVLQPRNRIHFYEPNNRKIIRKGDAFASPETTLEPAVNLKRKHESLLFAAQRVLPGKPRLPVAENRPEKKNV